MRTNMIANTHRGKILMEEEECREFYQLIAAESEFNTNISMQYNLKYLYLSSIAARNISSRCLILIMALLFKIASSL